MNISEIAQTITNAYKEKGITEFGIRTGRIAKIGEELERSHNWDHENDCFSDDLLSGTCSTGIGFLWFDGESEDEEMIKKAIEIHNDYPYNGEMTYIIGGVSSTYGEDMHELIIENAVVICIIK